MAYRRRFIGGWQSARESYSLTKAVLLAASLLSWAALATLCAVWFRTQVLGSSLAGSYGAAAGAYAEAQVDGVGVWCSTAGRDGPALPRVAGQEGFAGFGYATRWSSFGTQFAMLIPYWFLFLLFGCLPLAEVVLSLRYLRRSAGR